MICSCSAAKAQAKPLPKIDKNSDKEQMPQDVPSTHAREHFWSPITAGPYLVPVSRWIE